MGPGMEEQGRPWCIGGQHITGVAAGENNRRLIITQGWAGWRWAGPEGVARGRPGRGT